MAAVSKRNRIRYNRAETRAAWLLLLPSVIGLTCITYLPMIASFALSLFNWNGLGDMKFVGFENYVRLFSRDTKFYGSLVITLEYAGISVIGSIIYSMIIAMLLNRKVPARGFFRAVFYLPYVLPALAVYLGWKWLYDYNHGLFNYLIKLNGGTSVKFLDSSSMVTPSLALIAVWLSGNLIVIFLAGLQNVPRTYHEAAEIDGANAWQRFWKITIPCMTPIIFYNLLMSLVSNLQVITPALSLTQGGPGIGSYFMCFMLYTQAFKSHKYGYGSSIAVILFALIAVFTGILFATSKSWIFYEGDVEMVEFNTTEGGVGIYKNHEPMTVIIRPGVMTITETEGEKKAALHAGFVEILQDKVTILAESIEWPDEIDVERAQSAEERARERIASKAGDVDIDRASIALQRALARINCLK